MLWSRSSLVICFIYSSVYLLIPNFQFFLPPPFPFGSLFSMSVVYFCLVNKFICIIFLGSTHMMSCDIGLCLTLVWSSLGQSMLLQLALFHCFFYGWVIFYCTCVHHHLYPFICWWTFRLLPYCDSNFKITNALFACGVECNCRVIESMQHLGSLLPHELSLHPTAPTDLLIFPNNDPLFFHLSSWFCIVK